MKRSQLALILLAILLHSMFPLASADTLTFPCGPQGETYSVSLPEGIARANGDCVGSIVIDSKVKKIDYAGFSGLRLKSVTIPDSVVEIGDKAFWNIGLETVTLGRSVEKIGRQAFMNTKITSIQFPDSLIEIGDSAFESSYLGWRNEIVLPNSLKIIGDKVFWGSRLESISVPDNLQKLGKDVFVGTSLTKIIYCGKLTGFNVTNDRPIQFIEPICPPERQARFEAAEKVQAELKAKQEEETRAADKVAAEKAAALICETNRSIVYDLNKALLGALYSYPKSASIIKAELSKLFPYLDSKCIDNQTVRIFQDEVLKIYQAAKNIANKPTTIICVKGKLTKKITGVDPKCPTGYVKK